MQRDHRICAAIRVTITYLPSTMWTHTTYRVHIRGTPVQLLDQHFVHMLLTLSKRVCEYHLAKQMDTGKTPINIYIDLSKAFDTVDHAILLGFLHYYGN